MTVESDPSVTPRSVLLEVVDGVATVTINRPHRRNAMDWSVFDGLRAAADAVAQDDDVRVVVLRGAEGDFSAGLDVSLFAQFDEAVDEAFIARLQDAFTAFEDCPRPTVALIEGHCLGAGVQLAAACHLRLVAHDVRIAVAERRWGLVPDLGGTLRLPRLVGLGRATEWVATGRTIAADEALASGFAQAAMGPDRGAAFVADLAAAPGATPRAIGLLRDNLNATRAEAMQAEARAQLACLAGPDVAEAVAAATAGRPPRFVGR